MGQRIDEVNEQATLEEKAQRYDRLMTMIEGKPLPVEEKFELCPKCGSKMYMRDIFAMWRRPGVYGPGPDDYGRIPSIFWECTNTKCGFREEID